MQEKELIIKIKKGDKEAFSLLVNSFSQKVMNTCYKFLLNREDARDISQEVFIEVFQSIGSFREEAKLSTWIYRITVTKCLDEIKTRNRKKRITSLGRLLHLDELANWISGGVMPDRAMIEKENMDEMMEALNGLPDNQRVAFTLSKIEGYTNPEIAEIMNTTTIAVESLVYRAKKRVCAALERIMKKNK